MKNIELTEEHKAKLLEMCKILFPEYPNLEVRDSMEDFCSDQEQLFIELNEVIDRRKCTIIHWFEFCITHLAEKLLSDDFRHEDAIYDESSTPPLQLFRGGMHLEYDKTLPKHPIDYLYKEFKKLKHEKI